MSVTARFACYAVEDFGNNKTAKFNATKRTDGDNAAFTKYTPNGKLEISIMSEAPASEFFKPGKDYQLEFTEL